MKITVSFSGIETVDDAKKAEEISQSLLEFFRNENAEIRLERKLKALEPSVIADKAEERYLETGKRYPE